MQEGTNVGGGAKWAVTGCNRIVKELMEQLISGCHIDKTPSSGLPPQVLAHHILALIIHAQ